MLTRRKFIASAPLALAACGAETVWAPDEVLRQAIYRHDGPPRLTLFTMRSTSSDSGAHTSLMINASQRVIFDPAGSFAHPSIPERNDLIYGVTPRVEAFYVSYHARETYYVQRQAIDVTPSVAETAFRLAQTAGPVPKAQCALSTGQLLRQLPGFEAISPSYFPVALTRQFARLPGVQTRDHRETDPDNNRDVLLNYVTLPD